MLILATHVVADASDAGHMTGWGWGWLAMVGFGVVVLALFAVGIWAVVSSAPSVGSERSRKTGEEILDERYARGEIDREEYKQRRADLPG